MLVFSSASFLGLALLAAPVSAEQSPLPVCESGTRYIELDATLPSTPPELCIRPELSLNLFFDAKLARVVVERQERFRRVKVADDTLTLVASEALHDGERVPVTVYFQDDAVPASATFVLVLHPTQAERQVEVSRHERTMASLRQGEQQARAEAQQCREEKARLQAECSGPVGLTGLIANGWLEEKNVVFRKLSAVAERPGNALEASRVRSYRTVGLQRRGRVAVKVELFNPPGRPSWTPAGAALLGSKQEELSGLTVWPLKPIPPGKAQVVTVEMNAAADEAQGAFTLKLWAKEAGVGDVNLDGVTFP
ncbi:hypothetical protein D187_008673 [Cystobacter fuscus DSM 2262]|uniref:DUF2381 family protein n=1 Tax=Cystobacter fuscus (strain ATCC 25194 / DSM 2262 / NBRC 100088 / M29) TaxID=1242864 RepID=S9PDN2_CYSF2|nr:DUF2381 family protein [Cystobacter fuscus]EPX62485.1 hypothetical protein D187_008673 [Cystobacter fuscus DSM 2262]